MAYRRHLLVVGNRTIDSPELLDALTERARAAPLRVSLLAPAHWHEREQALGRAERTAAALRDAGIEVAAVQAGDGDPLVAFREAWDPRRHDEVVVSTLDPSMSRWLGIDLPHRIERLTGCQVQHVVARPPRPAATPEHVEREPPNLVAGMASLLRGAGRS